MPRKRKTVHILARLEQVGDPDDGMRSVKTGCTDGHGNTKIAVLSDENVLGVDEEWTEEWPTKPGDYLFYGDYVSLKERSFWPRFHICHVGKSGDGKVMRDAGGQFLYKSEAYGVFKPLVTQPVPDLPNLRKKKEAKDGQ